MLLNEKPTKFHVKENPKEKTSKFYLPKVFE